jgi:hypothetical protein
VAKPNYAFEKRQRELAKKKKKEEKATRKAHPDAPDGEAPEGAEPDAAGVDAPVPAAGEAPKP